MDYSKEELLEAKRQIDSTLHKLRETVKTLEGKETPPGTNPKSPWPTGGFRRLPSPFP